MTQMAREEAVFKEGYRNRVLAGVPGSGGAHNSNLVADRGRAHAAAFGIAATHGPGGGIHGNVTFLNINGQEMPLSSSWK